MKINKYLWENFIQTVLLLLIHDIYIYIYKLRYNNKHAVTLWGNKTKIK